MITLTNPTSFENLQIFTLAQECGSADATIDTLIKAVNSLSNLVHDLRDDNADTNTLFAAIEMDVALAAVERHKTLQKENHEKRDDFLFTKS